MKLPFARSLRFKRSPRFIRSLRTHPLAFLVASLCAMSASANVYFSEYIEGSSNNKALEIYNSGDSAVDLSGYKVEMYSNGNTTTSLVINLSGSIPAQGVFVLAHGSADASILAVANQTNSAGWYNGNDAVVLKNGSNVIDTIGQIGFNPGTEWGTGLISTADNTLRRKTSVTAGDTNPNDAFDPSTEWEGYATNTFDHLGTYQGSSNGGGNNGGGNNNGGNNGSCGDSATLISSIQGSDANSPMLGNTVSIEAIVVADFQNANELGGFFVQEEDAQADSNSQTSEGIYIASTSAVNIGDRVRVSGTVSETYGLTQITTPTVTLCASNQTLPTPASFHCRLHRWMYLKRLKACRWRLHKHLPSTKPINSVATGRYCSPMAACNNPPMWLSRALQQTHYKRKTI